MSKRKNLPPQKVWCVVSKSDMGRKTIPATASSKAAAIRLIEDEDEVVVGPFVFTPPRVVHVTVR